MSHIAFYAPLKAPDHPNPSGDRLIARLLMKALRTAGHEVSLASRFRTQDRSGDATRQGRMIQLGKALAQRLIRQWEKQGYRPDVWFTYHLYYKAPDLIGPHVAKHYDIPYLVAEASWAGKREGGDWHGYHKQLEQALEKADAIFTLNPHDEAALKRFLDKSSAVKTKPPLAPSSTDYKTKRLNQKGIPPSKDQDLSKGLPLCKRGNEGDLKPLQQPQLVRLPPFLDIATINKAPQAPLVVDHQQNRLITIAMMRPGDKLHSYRLLAEATRHVKLPFQWFMVGDGKERQTVEQLFENDSRIQFTGLLDSAEVHALLSECELHVWPAVNEAFGMTLLEAQYQNVAILSGDEGGVRYVMADGVTGELVKARDPQALAATLNRLLQAPDKLHAYRKQARSYIEANHSLDQAAKILDQSITNLLHRKR